MAFFGQPPIHDSIDIGNIHDFIIQSLVTNINMLHSSGPLLKCLCDVYPYYSRLFLANWVGH